MDTSILYVIVATKIDANALPDFYTSRRHASILTNPLLTFNDVFVLMLAYKLKI